MRAGKLNTVGKISQPGWEKIFETEIGASTPASQLLLTFQGVDSQTPAAADSGQTITWAGTSKLIGPKAVTAVGSAQLSDMKHPVTFVGTAALDDMKPTVTFAGTAQLDTAQKVFGRSSLLLDGNSDYITLPDSENWNFGSGNFTIDCWVRYTGDITTEQYVCGQYADASNYWRLWKHSAGNGHALFIDFTFGGSAKGIYQTAGWTPVVDTWYHYAFVRSGTGAYIFINGVAQALFTTTAFGTNDVGNVSGSLRVGAWVGGGYANGWIDEVRVSKGTARWTSNFTVPTVEYVPDDYAKLILHFNGADAAVTTKDFARHTKFGNTALYLDGNSDYVSMPVHPDWNFGAGDFTIDCWVNFSSIGQDQAIVSQYADNDNRWVLLFLNDEKLLQFYYKATSVQANYTGAFDPAVNAWYHIALVRNGTNVYIFVNGVSLSLTEATAISTTTLTSIMGSFEVGHHGALGLYMYGDIDELRVSKGTARWTSAFTPPTAPYETDDYTKLLLHFDGADGDVATEDSADQPKFGDTCLLLDGNSDYVTLPDSEDWDFSGDFTVDCWIKPTAFADGGIAGNCDWYNGSDGWGLFLSSTTGIGFNCMWSGSTWAHTMIVSHGMAVNTWNHVAVVRSGTTITIYVNGVSKYAKANSPATSITCASNLMTIGANPVTPKYFSGMIDEVRISKGIARWTSAFTPPTELYEKDEYTACLLHFDGYNSQTHMIDSAQRGKVGSSALWLDGDSDYVTLADSDDWAFGTGDFTIDCWLKLTNTNDCVIASQYVDASNYWAIWKTSTYISYNSVVGGVEKAQYRAGFTATLNAWYHLAFVRNGTNFYIMIDGDSKTLTTVTAISTNDVGNFASTLRVGMYNSNYWLGGHVDGFRVTKGTALWTADFTPPTTPEDYVGTKAITIFGLEGDRDEQYLLSTVFACTGSAAGLGLKINGDLGATYGEQVLYGSDTTIAAARNAAKTSQTLCSASTGTIGSSKLLIYAKSGYVRTLINKRTNIVSGTTVDRVYAMGNSWNNSVDEIASITVFTSELLASGTIVSLYRRIEA